MKIKGFLMTLSTKIYLTTIFLSFTACSSGPSPDEINVDEDLKCSRNGSPAPEWVCKNVVGDNLQTVTGSSDYSRIGTNFMLREATLDGQKSMQRVVTDYVDDKLNSLSRQIGGPASEAIDKMAQKIAQEVGEEKKEDYKQIKLWSNPTDSSIEVLMAIQNKNINKDVRHKLMLILKKDNAVYKAFQEADGDDMLDEFLPLN